MFGPKQQEREEMERTKKRNGVTGERAAPGTPHHRCSMTGAGPKGEPWEREGEALLKCVVGKG